MPKKIVKFGTDARKALKKGVDIVVSAVQTSYGPAGRTSVIAPSYGMPSISNDGVTIAKSIELEGAEQMGVALIQQAASKTNDIAGDGTSSTTILAGALISEGLKVVESGVDPVKLRSGMRQAVNHALNEVSKMSTPVKTKEDKASVATISSRSTEIGNMVASILEEVGQTGVVTVQNGDSNKIEMEVTAGMQFDKGYKSHYFVTDTAKMEAVVEKPLIMVTDKKIASVQEILPVIEEMVQSGRKDLVLIAEDVEGEALATFIINKVKGIFNIYPVQAPAFGDRRKAMLEDIAVLTGATFISTDLGMQTKSAKLNDLGQAAKVIISKDSTTIVGGMGSRQAVNNRAALIQAAILEAKTDYDKEKLAERIAKLTGGVGVLKVGAATEVEMKELKYIVEDAVNATKAAIVEGVVPGGASTFVRLAATLNDLKGANDEETMGIGIVRKALLAPFRAIANNSGIYDIALIQKEIEGSSKAGYDFSKLESVTDMIASGIIDPTMVIRQAIMNASSIAGSVITTEVVVFDEPRKEEEGRMPAGGMGGMGMDY